MSARSGPRAPVPVRDLLSPISRGNYPKWSRFLNKNSEKLSGHTLSNGSILGNSRPPIPPSLPTPTPISGSTAPPPAVIPIADLSGSPRLITPLIIPSAGNPSSVPNNVPSENVQENPIEQITLTSSTSIPDIPNIPNGIIPNNVTNDMVEKNEILNSSGNGTNGTNGLMPAITSLSSFGGINSSANIIRSQPSSNLEILQDVFAPSSSLLLFQTYEVPIQDPTPPLVPATTTTSNTSISIPSPSTPASSNKTFIRRPLQRVDFTPSHFVQEDDGILGDPSETTVQFMEDFPDDSLIQPVIHPQFHPIVEPRLRIQETVYILSDSESEYYDSDFSVEAVSDESDEESSRPVSGESSKKLGKTCSIQEDLPILQGIDAFNYGQDSIIITKTHILINDKKVSTSYIGSCYAVYDGNIYMLFEKSLYILDSSSYNEDWRWIKKEGFSSDIIDLAATGDERLLWIQTINEGIYFLDDEPPRRFNYPSQYRRIYGNSPDIFLDIQNGVLEYQGKSYSCVRHAGIDFAQNLYILSGKIPGEKIAFLNWKPYRMVC